MRILVVHSFADTRVRGGINEHLYSFKNYSDAQCYYLNSAYGIPGYISRIDFDLIVYFDTFCNKLRWMRPDWKKAYGTLINLKGYKIAIPQDEYFFSDRLNEFFLNFGIKTVFTCLNQPDWKKVYPLDKSGLDYYFTVYTGYIDEAASERQVKLMRRHRLRPIDLGYRARKAPYRTGRFGMIKWQLTEKFLDPPIKHGLKFDLSNNENDTFYGDRWYKFLGDCRVVLGCESGASLHDPDGSLTLKLEQYIKKHPEANFNEAETACFPGLDGNLDLFTLSPRHFEACITRTCQALVEGQYGGIFKPGIHYIEIKKDWSNITNVIKQIEDVDYCERIADNAYRDIVETGLYTYRNYVQMILNHVKSAGYPLSPSVYPQGQLLRSLEQRDRFPYIVTPFIFFYVHTRRILSQWLIRLNLYDSYKKLTAIMKTS
jgi:hypothetical protein